MADKDITVAFKTTSDNSGVEETIKGIQEVPDAAAESLDAVTAAQKKAGDEQVEAAKKTSAELGKVKTALSEQAESLGKTAEESGKYSKKLDEIATASRTLVAIQTVDMLKKATAGLREATEAGGVLNEQFGDMGPALDVVDNGLSMMSAGLSAAVSTGNPLIGVLAGVAAGVAATIKAYEEMRAAEDAAAAAEKNAEEMKRKLLDSIQFRKENLSLITQVEGIAAENEALADQEEALNRMIELREKLAGQANTAARQEVQLAKLKGGDVALAEADAIATELAGSLQTLNGKLASAQSEAGKATAIEVSANAAWALAQKEVAQGIRELWDKDTQEIKSNAEKAREEGAQSRQNLADFITTGENTRLEILRKAEIDAATKEKEFEGKASTAAKGAFDKVDQTLRSELEKSLGKQNEATKGAIETIKIQSGAISDKAKEKSAEVKAETDKERAATENAIKAIAPKPEDTRAVVAAVNATGKAITDQSNAMITALNQLTTGISSVTSRLSNQQTQINQLFSRIR